MQVVDDCRGSSFEFAQATGEGRNRTYLLRSGASDELLSSVQAVNVGGDSEVRRMRPMQYALMSLVQVSCELLERRLQVHTKVPVLIVLFFPKTDTTHVKRSSSQALQVLLVCEHQTPRLKHSCKSGS